MAWIKTAWTAAEADSWSKEDVLAWILSPLTYILSAVCILFICLLRWYGFVLLAVDIVLLLVLFRVIDPKLKAISEDYERKQKAYLEDIEKIARQKAAAGTAGQEWLSFLDFLKVLSEHLPADQGAVIQSVAFRGQKVTIRGEARDTDSFEALARGLEMAGKFDVRTPFRMRSGRPNSPARLAFTIELSPRTR